MRCALWILLVFIAAAIIVTAVVLMRFNLTALNEPGPVETSVANWGKHFLIRRASRENIPPPPPDKTASIASGRVLYGVDCSMCHGPDGHTPTDNGRWMYPRAADLTSEQVQSYSDRELFWIVKNGIRLSGMPAFGKLETEEHIWNLVNYVRSLPQYSSPNPSK